MRYLLRVGERRAERIGVARDQRIFELSLGAMLGVKQRKQRPGFGDELVG